MLNAGAVDAIVVLPCLPFHTLFTLGAAATVLYSLLHGGGGSFGGVGGGFVVMVGTSVMMSSVMSKVMICSCRLPMKKLFIP